MKTIQPIINLQQKLFIFVLLFVGSLLLVNPVYAETNIDATNKWAWNDAIGWINFYSSNSVNVTVDKLTGYALIESTGEEISFDCETSPLGDICATQGNYFVGNDVDGKLDGWAWNDSFGWISFCGGLGTTDCPGTVSYQVTINPTTDEFEGWAWNDLIGWISFNCSNNSACGTSNYKVETSWVQPTAVSGWLISNTFDTGFTDGVGYNSIMWLGDPQQAGNSAKFQFATSDCENGGANQTECDDTLTSYWGDPKTSGDGAFVGSDGTSSTFYGPSLSGIPNVIYTHHVNKQYYRYKIYLDRAEGNTLSPLIEDVIINWSR